MEEKVGDGIYGLSDVTARQLQSDILAGRFCGKLPSETEISEKYAVSRGTMRRSLAILEKKGLILRRHGRGTFVSADVQSGPPSAKSGHESIVLIAWSLQYPQAYDEMAAAMLRVEEEGLNLMIWDSECGTADIVGFAKQLTSDWVKGVVIHTVPLEPFVEATAIIVDKNIPLVALDNEIGGAPCDLVRPDQFGGAYAAARHLIGSWRCPAYYLGIAEGASSERDCYAGYCRAMLEAGFSDVSRYVISITEKSWITCRKYIKHPWEGALEVVREKFQQLSPPIPVVCGDDFQACSVYMVAKEMGWEIGVDVGVTGYGDQLLCQMLTPRLTSVGPYYKNIAAEAISLVLHRIAGFSGPPLKIVKPIPLKIRESSSRRKRTSVGNKTKTLGTVPGKVSIEDVLSVV